MAVVSNDIKFEIIFDSQSFEAKGDIANRVIKQYIILKACSEKVDATSDIIFHSIAFKIYTLMWV